MTTAQDVVDIVREAFGVALHLDMTGGNCGALSGTLESGHVIVITDCDVLVYSDGMSQQMYEGISVGIYTHGGWYGVPADQPEEDPESLVDAYNEGTDRDTILRTINEALDALVRKERD